MQRFEARGTVRELNADGRTVVIHHESITNYMDAMTMPFKVKDTNQLRGLALGDEVRFRLLVSEKESWIDRVTKIGHQAVLPIASPSGGTNTVIMSTNRHPLLQFPFTNQFGTPVTLDSFRGNALGITFFFTHCPIPEYCPRLSRNFEEASQKLSSLPDTPTNWHFLSVSIDPQKDTPEVLRTYAERYHYDSNHWTFLTGSAEKIRELASLSGVTYEAEGAFLNHNFRTLIIAPNGALRKSFPIGGNLSEQIAEEIRAATRAGNHTNSP